MSIPPFLECPSCYLSVCFNFSTSRFCYSGPVDNCPSLAVALQRAHQRATSAVAASLLCSARLVVLQNFLVVLCNCFGDVWHALLTELDRFSVKQLVEGVGLRKGSV